MYTPGSRGLCGSQASPRRRHGAHRPQHLCLNGARNAHGRSFVGAVIVYERHIVFIVEILTQPLERVVEHAHCAVLMVWLAQLLTT